MSKCSECDQTLPTPPPPLRAVLVTCDSFNHDSFYRTAAIRCSVVYACDCAALGVLMDHELMLVPKKQLKAGQGNDWHDLFLKERRQVQTLQARNAELVRKLDDVRRTAAL